MTAPKANPWLPYVSVVVLVGGFLVQYGYARAKIEQLEESVRRLEAEQNVDNQINNSEHAKWWPSILAAEQTK